MRGMHTPLPCTPCHTCPPPHMPPSAMQAPYHAHPCHAPPCHTYPLPHMPPATHAPCHTCPLCHACPPATHAFPLPHTPPAMHIPHHACPPWHAGNERVVGILLECILVHLYSFLCFMHSQRCLNRQLQRSIGLRNYFKECR